MPSKKLRQRRYLLVEALENRTLLSTATVGSLLVQLRDGIEPGHSDLARIAVANNAQVQPTRIDGLYEIHADHNRLAALQAAYARDPSVRYAAPLREGHLDRVPNDPFFTSGTQWGLNGPFGIHAPQAWDVTTGSTRVVMANIDSGTYLDHEDLYLNTWINQGEIPAARRVNLTDLDGDGLITFYDLNNPINQGVGKIMDVNGDGRITGTDLLAPFRADGTGGWANGISDDGDRYVDDLVGWDFRDNDNDPSDGLGHGIHTTGIAMAAGDNGRGIAGVNWQVQMMALRFVSNSGTGNDLNAAEAIRYAADHGAKVSNNSYGFGQFSQVLFDAVQYAGTRGHLVVASAGNANLDLDRFPQYPACYDLGNVLSVAATTMNGSRASFSSYGARTVDLGAPGEGIYSTMNFTYGYMSGTSQAAPFVTGVAGLLWAQNPSYTVEQVVDRILSSTTPTPGLAGVTVTGGLLNAQAALQAVPGTLRVTALARTPSGFTAQLSMPIESSVLNLYDTEGGGLGPADVTLTGATTGPVAGTLVVDPSGRRVTFVRTGGVLPTDTYTVVLRSAVDGFRTPAGDLLDGNGDGTPGDNYTTSFSVAPSAAVVVSVADFVRGPGQAVNVPAGTVGLPLRVSNAAGITSISLTLQFNPALLNVTGAVTVIPGTMGIFSSPSPGTVLLSLNSPTPLAAGTMDFARLVATVPDNAPYTSKLVIEVAGLRINDSAIEAVGDSGVGVIGYFGDTTGNGTLSSADAARALRVAVGLDGGFSAYQLADPVLIADVTGNGVLNAADATRILQAALGIAQPSIPPLPPNPPSLTPGGPDPLLRFPRHLRGRPGQTLTVPLLLTPSDGLQFADLAIAFDTRRLELLSVERGSLTADFDLFATHPDAEAGTLRVGLGRSAGPIADRGAGSILLLTFRVRADAPPGRAVINLRHEVAGTLTQLNEGALDLTPDPSDAAGDRLDGILRVRRRPTP
jgi:hypothetical protein